MRNRLLLLLMLLCLPTVAPAQVSIGINFSLFPELVRVPNYPVYYAPRQNANYFFYDGMYWVFQSDEWYSSDWYNGPWWRTGPEYVPDYLLRIPVRYYRRPPAYFHGWGRDAPPRWGEHWGRDWEQRRSGWDHWDRRAAPAPAPLPTYQRQYAGNKYPRVEEQHAIQDQKYRYQPKDTIVREHVQPQMRGTPAPSARERQPEPQRKDSAQDTRDRGQKPGPSNAPAQKSEPAAPPQQPPTARERSAEPQRQDAGKNARERDQRPAPANQAVQKPEPAAQPQRQQSRPEPAAQQPRPQPQPAPQREQPAPKPAVQPQRPQPQAAPPREQQTPRPEAQQQRPQPQAAPPRAPAADSNRGQDKGQDKGRDKGEERGHESNK